MVYEQDLLAQRNRPVLSCERIPRNSHSRFRFDCDDNFIDDDSATILKIAIITTTPVCTIVVRVKIEFPQVRRKTWTRHLSALSRAVCDTSAASETFFYERWSPQRAYILIAIVHLLPRPDPPPPDCSVQHELVEV